MNKVKKKEWISNFKSVLESSRSMVVANIKGITVSELESLRTEAFENGVRVMVVKNTLARLAVQDTDFEAVSSLFSGQTVAFIAKTETGAAAISKSFSKFKDKISLVGACIDNTALDHSDLEELIEAGSIENVRAKLIGLLMNIPRMLASTINSPASSISRVINAYANKN